MKPAMPTAIVFDFFGVICSEVAPFWLERHFDKSEAQRIKSELVADADWGRITQAELFDQLGFLTGRSGIVVESEWLDLAKVDPSMVTLVDECAETRQVALLTNAPSGFVRSILRNFDLERRFSEIIVSSEMQVAKPDLRIFGLMTNKIGVLPEAAVLVDDNPNNVQAARDFGMLGHLFTTETSLRTFLEAGGD